MSLKNIHSLQNSLVKKILLLKDKGRERKKTGLFVLEGLRETKLALIKDYEIETLLFAPHLISTEAIQEFIAPFNRRTELISISKEVYQKLAYRDSTEGIVAIAKHKLHSLNILSFKNKNPLVLIAEAPEKPGNIGALLRTADAAAVDAVIIANPRGDIYNPNIIRSSVGCIFTTKIGMGSTEEVIQFLNDQNINIYCAALSASKNYTDINFKMASAIVMGTEATGLSNTWLDASLQNIIIPMSGEIDSMNVSVSAAILIFEAKRQRNWLL